VGQFASIAHWDVGLIIIGMVIIQPTAPMGIYGVISNKAPRSRSHTILIAMVAMLFTAISLWPHGARFYPSAGSAYTYVGRRCTPPLGYVVGWGHGDGLPLEPAHRTAFCAKAAMNIVPGLSYYVWIIIFCGLLYLGESARHQDLCTVETKLCAREW